MGTHRRLPGTRIILFSIVLLVTGLSCSLFTKAAAPIVSPDDASSAALPPATAVIQSTVPPGWKMSTDASGACQISTPPGWQLGQDFYFEAGKTDPGPIQSAPGHYPPLGAALWGNKSIDQFPEGSQFQVRQSLVIGETVCSVWRVKKSADFTAAEKSEMEAVGKTLQGVR